MDGLFSSHRRPNFGKRPVDPPPDPQLNKTPPQATRVILPLNFGEPGVLTSSVFMKKKEEAANSHDLACAVALGLVEAKHMTVTLDAIITQDSSSRSSKVRKDWLDEQDPLGVLTRELLEITAATVPPPSAMALIGIRSKPAKSPEEIQDRVHEIQQAAIVLLRERCVFDQAKFLGLKLCVDEHYRQMLK